MIEHLRSLPLEQKIGQLFFIGIPGPELDAATRGLLDEISPGGVCLFARNIRERQQTRHLLDNLRTELAVQPLLSVDQEGGLVDRLRRIMTPMPSASSITSAKDAAELGRIIAETLRMLGFNMDIAPVVDVVDEQRAKYTNGLIDRAFGRSSVEAVERASAFLDALRTGGIMGCLKHFPGLGAAQVDSHEELPIVNIEEAELRATDLLPYHEMLNHDVVRAVMAAHATYPSVALQEVGQNGKLLPSSISYNFITTLLRGELAFDGLVITDDLEMGAIINNYGIGDACNMAINAGDDMLAICADPAAVREGFRSVLQAAISGQISSERIDQSLSRIAAVKEQLASPLDLDDARLDALSDEVASLAARSHRK